MSSQGNNFNEKCGAHKRRPGGWAYQDGLTPIYGCSVALARSMSADAFHYKWHILLPSILAAAGSLLTAADRGVQRSHGPDFERLRDGSMVAL